MSVAGDGGEVEEPVGEGEQQLAHHVLSWIVSLIILVAICFSGEIDEFWLAEFLITLPVTGMWNMNILILNNNNG